MCDALTCLCWPRNKKSSLLPSQSPRNVKQLKAWNMRAQTTTKSGGNAGIRWRHRRLENKMCYQCSFTHTAEMFHLPCQAMRLNETGFLCQRLLGMFAFQPLHFFNFWQICVVLCSTQPRSIFKCQYPVPMLVPHKLETWWQAREKSLKLPLIMAK